MGYVGMSSVGITPGTLRHTKSNILRKEVFMKRIYLFLIAAFMAFMLTGCSAFGQPVGQAEKQPVEQSVDVGKEIEQFGFVFTIPQSVTSNGMDDGIYDIDFGVAGQREAFIGINPPEDMTGKGDDDENLLQLQMEDMQRATLDYFDDIHNEVMEIRKVDGNPVGYMSLDCTIYDLPIQWQMYMMILDDMLYSFTIQIYADVITEDTLATIDRFVMEIQLVGEASLLA